MPGPMLDLILEKLKETDKGTFRKKILEDERREEQARRDRGEMTREMTMRADAAQASQFYLDIEGRELSRDGEEEEIKPDPAKVEVKPDDKTAYAKFMDQFKI